MKKAFFFWLYFVLAIILAVYFAVRIITTKMGRGPITNIKNVYITSDLKDINLDSIKMAIGINNSTNIHSVDLQQINNRVMGIPGIKNSAIRKLANGDIDIKIQQHKIAAQYYDGNSYYPLSDEGVKIETPSNQRNPNTILIRGVLPETVGDIVSSLSIISEYIDYITMVESRRWNIHTKNGTIIYLPEKNPIVAINKINTLNQQHKLLSRYLDIIDMRDDARILVKERK